MGERDKGDPVKRNQFHQETFLCCQVEMAGEFTDEGTETHFAIGSQPAYVRAVSSGNKRSGILHSLVVHDTEVPEFVE